MTTKNPTLQFENSLNSSEREFLKKAVNRASQIKPWLGLSYLALDWAIIAGVIIALESLRDSPYYLGLLVFGIFTIAARQHALAVVAHEGAHYRLMNSPRLNTWIPNLFCAYPLFYQLEAYRHTHLNHHRYTNTELDPDMASKKGMADYQFPMSRRRLLSVFALDLMGRGFLQNIRRMRQYNSSKKERIHATGVPANTLKIRLTYYLICFTLLTLIGGAEGWRIFLIYWMLPLLWILPAMLRHRNITEHYGLSWEDNLHSSRNVNCSWIEGWFLAPHYIRIHLVHHLYPSVPFYNLVSLRNELMKIETFRTHAKENSSYILPVKNAVWREITA